MRKKNIKCIEITAMESNCGHSSARARIYRGKDYDIEILEECQNGVDYAIQEIQKKVLKHLKSNEVFLWKFCNNKDIPSFVNRIHGTYKQCEQFGKIGY